MNSEIDTTYSKPLDEFNQRTHSSSENLIETNTVSDWEEIDFPKIRVLRFNNKKTEYRISVDLERLSKQIKFYSSNK